MAVFTCTRCGRQISRLSGPETNVCAICNWIDTNVSLTPTEREELRKRLCVGGSVNEDR